MDYVEGRASFINAAPLQSGQVKRKFTEIDVGLDVHKATIAVGTVLGLRNAPLCRALGRRLHDQAQQGAGRGIRGVQRGSHEEHDRRC